jgi:DNA-binding transcriptional LysR family regulator
MLRLRQLEIFRALMIAGTITEAARLLHVSQPAASRMLRRMEDQLGLTLFRRERGRLQATVEASRLYDEVEKVFRTVTVVEKYAEDLRDAQAGALSLASTPTLSYALLADAIARFRTSRPRVRVWVQVTTTRQILDLAETRQIDLGLIHTPIDDSRLEVRTLFETEVVCVMPAHHPLAARRTVGPGDLKGRPLITNVRNNLIASQLERVFLASGRGMEVAIGANNTLTACCLVRAGAGVALVDPLSVAQAFPDLIQRPFRPRVAIHPRIVRSRHQPPSRLAASFEDELCRLAAGPEAGIHQASAGRV